MASQKHDTGQISENNLSSYTYSQLNGFIISTFPPTKELKEKIPFYEYEPLPLFGLDNFCKSLVKHKKYLKKHNKELFVFLYDIMIVNDQILKSNIIVMRSPHRFLLLFDGINVLKYAIQLDNGCCYDLVSNQKQAIEFQSNHYTATYDFWKELCHLEENKHKRVKKIDILAQTVKKVVVDKAKEKANPEAMEEAKEKTMEDVNETANEKEKANEKEYKKPTENNIHKKKVRMEQRNTTEMESLPLIKKTIEKKETRCCFCCCCN